MEAKNPLNVFTLIRGDKHYFFTENMKDHFEQEEMIYEDLRRYFTYSIEGAGFLQVDYEFNEIIVRGKCDKFGTADHYLTKRILEFHLPEFGDVQIFPYTPRGDLLEN